MKKPFIGAGRTCALSTLAGLVGLSLGSMCLMGGCSGEVNIDIDHVADLLNNAVGTIQDKPQRLPDVLVNQGDTVIIDNSVTIIDDPATDISVTELPNETIFGIENDTGFDIYVRYYADNDLQAVYVFDGEALLLDYPCLDTIALVSEDDIDPASGTIFDSFDLTGADFFNPDDFQCGDAFILNFNASSIDARTEVVDLVH